MTGLSQGYSFPVLFHNIHLFGDSGLYTFQGATQETPFYWRDHERLPQLIDRYKRCDAAVIGLAEVWDPAMYEEIRSELRTEYPYQVVSPTAPGIGPIINRIHETWPRVGRLLFGPGGGAVGRLTGSHYNRLPGLLGEIVSYLSEDLLVRGIQKFLNRAAPVLGFDLPETRKDFPVWESGLLLLSRYPILSSEFYTHEERADWAQLTRQGVIEATVKAEHGIPVTLSLTHIQEGTSSRCVAVRQNQIAKSRQRTRHITHPLVHFGDYNVTAGTPEHRAMRDRLGGLYEVVTDDTYVNPNDYQKKMKAQQEDETSERIDYVNYNDEMTIRSGRVLRDYFRSDNGAYDLSDHFAVWADFFLRPWAAVQRLRARAPIMETYPEVAAAAAVGF